jgi:hypothetical protein
MYTLVISLVLNLLVQRATNSCALYHTLLVYANMCIQFRELTLAPLLAEAIYRVHKRIPFPELLYDTPDAVEPPKLHEGRGADGAVTPDPFFEA